jgi:hypothetical protein
MCRWRAWRFAAGGLLLALLAGCGTTKTRNATEQLLMSDAVDRSIAVIDFAPLAGKAVYFDTKYLVVVKGVGFVNAEYVTSALRQQMLASGCLLQDKPEDAEYVVEARIGALGTDAHDVTYGIPPSSGIAQAAEMLPNVPRVPIPDISLARKEDLLGASKVAVFAYHRETKIPVWQSGISVATSNARDSFILGVGPVQDGTIYHGTHFAGSRMQIPLLSGKRQAPPTRGLVSYYDEVQFDKITGRFGIPRKPTPEELNSQIEAIVKVPKLSPLTEQMFTAMGSSAQPPPGPPTPPAEPAPPGSSGPAAIVAERPKPLPAVSPDPPPAGSPPAGAATPPPADATTPPPTAPPTLR